MPAEQADSSRLRLRRAAALAGLLLGAWSGVGAANAVLGQPLDFSVQLRLEVPETLTAQCVLAEVTAGEMRLPPSAVITRVEMLGVDRARVRVATVQAINEPIIGVDLTMGCTNRMLRRYVLLADPPGGMGAAAASPPPPALVDPAQPVASVLAQAESVPPLVPEPASVPAGPTGAGPVGATDSVVPPPAAGLPEPPAPVAAEAGPSQAAPPAPPPAVPPPARRTQPPAPRAAAAAPGRTAQPQAQPQARVQPPRRPPPQRTARATPPAPTPVPAPRAAAPVSRLQMDMLEPGAADDTAIINEALNAVAQAASAARAAAAAASESAQRIAALEATVAELRAESQARDEASSRLRERLQRADVVNRWLLPLVLLVVLLALLSGWLAWRMAFLRSRQQERWNEAVRPDGPRSTSASGAASRREGGPNGRLATAPIPFVTAELRGPASGRGARAAPAWPPPAAVEDSGFPAMAPAAVAGAALAAEDSQFFPRTVVRPDPRPILPPSWAREPAAGAQPKAVATSLSGLPPLSNREPDPHPTAPMLARMSQAEPGATRDVSIEELIDLEQQAEFFVVLGQDEAAVELLVEHLRSTGGGSPLPYLKLLEIHQRLGDREAYERTRARFNHRFNAYAPEWGADIHGGRSLEDYPGVVPRLQQVWNRPLDAMAELEALLFRKSRGDLFDLPAYREVLFLYSLARDLLDREAADTGSVDLLLPLADGGQFSSTAPAPLTDLEHDTIHDPLHGPDFDTRPTAPVDFDISTIDQPASIFDTQPDTLHDTLVPVRRSPG